MTYTQEALAQAIANTRETIALCDEGIALDKDRTYYDREKRRMVLSMRRDAQKRLANLLAMKAGNAS